MLGIDTCGPSGTVALGRLTEHAVEILGQIEIEGRTYSSTLVATVGDLLAGAGITVRGLGAIVAVSGPGSFTGVRVGLSAVKGFAEAADIPVIAVSRLEVLSHKSGLPSAALDAHRHEVFLRVQGPEGMGELLADVQELAAIDPAPRQIAVCDDAAAALLKAAWPATEIVQVAAPTAADALESGAAQVIAGEFVDVALLDAHYLRRSDAEIFGEPAVAEPKLA